MSDSNLFSVRDGVVTFNGVSNEVYARACKERDELKAEVERLKGENSRIAHSSMKMWYERDTLQAKLDKAIEALEAIAEKQTPDYMIKACDSEVQIMIAREALKLIKGDGK